MRKGREGRGGPRKGSEREKEAAKGRGKAAPHVAGPAEERERERLCVGVVQLLAGGREDGGRADVLLGQPGVSLQLQ